MPKAKKLPSGRWRVRVYTHKDAKGKKHYKSFTANTAKAAQYKASEYLLQSKREANIENIPLYQAYEKYIESRSNVLSPGTIREYKRQAKNDFPELRLLPLRLITQENVQAAVNNASLTKSPKTVRNMHGLLVAVLNIYRPNFILRTKLPQKEKTEIYIPTEEEIKTIYKTVKGTPMELPFLLASQAGLRAGEIAALQRSNVNKSKQTISISNSLIYDGSKYVLKQPKSYAGNRTIPLHPFIINLLLNTEPYRKNQEQEYIIGLTPNDITHRWEHILKQAGVSHFKFHTLRHYFASQAILKGLPKRYVAELMGHSSSKMLDQVYEHTFETQKNKLANEMVNLTQNLIV